MDFILIEDREPVSNLTHDTASLLRRLGLIKKIKVERIHFCGVIIADGRVFIFAPRNSLKSANLNSFQNTQFAALILRILNKYHSIQNSSVSGGLELEEGKEGLGLLSSILRMLNDYAANGLYTTSVKVRDINTGRINWSRTIGRETPYVGAGGSPVYLRLHSDRIRFNEQSPITLIHSEVIKELDRSFCWVITEDASIRIAPELESIPSSGLPIDAKIYHLKKELSLVYADREISLLNSLIDYLEAKEKGAEGEYLIGVRSFQNIWEEMLRCTIPGVININSSLPKPALYFKLSDNPILTKGMVTDIVSKREDVVSVLDAKYYKAETVDDSPGWSDIVKQLFYAKSLKIIFPDLLIANWFLFPGYQTEIDDGPISTIAIMDIVGNEPLVETFPPIGCSYFCPIDVMNKYVSLKKYSFEEVSALYNQVKIT